MMGLWPFSKRDTKGKGRQKEVEAAEQSVYKKNVKPKRSVTKSERQPLFATALKPGNLQSLSDGINFSEDSEVDVTALPRNRKLRTSPVRSISRQDIEGIPYS